MDNKKNIYFKIIKIIVYWNNFEYNFSYIAGVVQQKYSMLRQYYSKMKEIRLIYSNSIRTVVHNAGNVSLSCNKNIAYCNNNRIYCKKNELYLWKINLDISILI